MTWLSGLPDMASMMLSYHSPSTSFSLEFAKPHPMSTSLTWSIPLASAAPPSTS